MNLSEVATHFSNGNTVTPASKHLYDIGLQLEGTNLPKKTYRVSSNIRITSMAPNILRVLLQLETPRVSSLTSKFHYCFFAFVGLQFCQEKVFLQR